MRALVLADFGRFVVRDLARPVPGEGEVVLRIHATGICGSDLHGYTGENGRRVPGQVMGHESVGWIDALGDGVDEARYPLGAPATFNPVVVPEDEVELYRGNEQQAPGRVVVGVAADVVSAFAEYVALPARNIVLIGESAPLEHGALVEPLAVAAHAVRRAGLTAGMTLLVLGGGPVGQSVIVAAQQAGVSRILVSEVSAARRALCAQLGAVTIDPAGGPVHGQVRSILDGPVDCAIDAVGVSPTLRDALESTSLGGIVCLVGMGSPRLELDAYSVSTAERTVVGSFTYSADDFRHAAGWVRDQVVDFAPLISKVIDLDQADEEFARQTSGSATAGKVLVRVSTRGEAER